MTTFTLKNYQKEALGAFDEYLRQAQISGPRGAYELVTGGFGYNAEPFGDTPCVCLRIPTGGGKTLLAAHAVGSMTQGWPCPVPRPLVLWLVPSETIRAQTLAALSTPKHPFREALVQACGDDVRVCAVDDMRTLSAHDFDRRAVVAVATIQTFRVEDTGQRNVYAFDEALEPHFRSHSAGDILRALEPVRDAIVTAEEAARPGRELLAAFVGQPRFSLANWIALRKPFVIVDEAHNTKTERSFEALARLNPGLILELTATPVPKRTNVLYHVSAQQLQAEHMIKLPIRLFEHTRGWQATVLAAVHTQRRLEGEAQKEHVATGAYIRPIVLLQAQNSTDAVNAEALRRHLIDELHIADDQVKVATGTQRELDGLDLMSPDCPVRFIITVQALREGWDCPFAYVLCSVQSIRSATAIEQLLGRVLRMPYAARRERDALNVAYAHVSEAQTGQAANALADHLIDGMGFDPLDMASMVAPMVNHELPLDDGPLFAKLGAGSLGALAVDLPPGKDLGPAVADAVSSGLVQLTQDDTRQRAVIEGYVDEALEHALVEAQRGKRREAVTQQIERHNALMRGAEAPVNRGEIFPAIPRLCYRNEQGLLDLLEREAVMDTVEVDLLAKPVVLPTLARAEQAVRGWEVYIDGKRVRVGMTQAEQLALDGVRGVLSEADLVRWIADVIQDPRRNRAVHVVPAHLRAFVAQCVKHYIHEQRVPLEQLAVRQSEAVQAIGALMSALHDEAAERSFEQLVLLGGWPLELDPSRVFRFSGYPVAAHRRYEGKHRFVKHHFPVIADLKSKGEEFLCAQAIDAHPRVRKWVRNIDSNPDAGFSLPTSRQNFYPDFVCELDDGRLLLVEYKGAHIEGMAKEIEKRQVGQLWAKASEGRCVFVSITKQATSMTAQLDAAIGTSAAPALAG